MLRVDLIPVYDDNYAYLLHCESGVTAVVDPGEATPVMRSLESKGLKLDFILNTHHHWDHVNGNSALVEKYNCPIFAPEKEADIIEGVTYKLKDGEEFMLGKQRCHVIETPGHTKGGICFYFPDSHIVFTGDTLFSMGCGRLFEGTPLDMYNSFQKLKKLPDNTLVYCGHEYTKGNAGFCLSQDKTNEALKLRIEEVKSLRAEGKPTLPVSIQTEKQTNIFMKAKSAEEFAALRHKKDNF